MFARGPPQDSFYYYRGFVINVDDSHVSIRLDDGRNVNHLKFDMEAVILDMLPSQNKLANGADVIVASRQSYSTYVRGVIKANLTRSTFKPKYEVMLDTVNGFKPPGTPKKVRKFYYHIRIAGTIMFRKLSD